MHDIRAIRDNPDRFQKAWARRSGGVHLYEGRPVVEKILELDASVRQMIGAKETAEQTRNAKSKEIGKAKASGDETRFNALRSEVEGAKMAIERFGAREFELTRERDDLLARLPNLPADDVPDGVDETANKEVKHWREPRKFNFPPKDHADLGEALKMMDFEAAARMSGTRFVVLKGQLARLERALAAFMLDIQTGENGYVEHAPPLLVKDHAMFGTGQLPKFEIDLFGAKILTDSKDHLDVAEHLFVATGLKEDDQKRIINTMVELGPELHRRMDLVAGLSLPREAREGLLEALNHWHVSEAERLVARSNQQERRKLELLQLEQQRSIDARVEQLEDFYLISTSEISLTNIVREQILDAPQLPMRMTAATPCFRSEAGSAGRDTKGMIRMHQFIKVELVSITTPEESEKEHERMTRCAETILERLELPYRTVMLCAGDMGFGARKTYDLEVWLPSQNTYREISSCSNCGDFQARRMDARFRRGQGEKPEFVHTLNGSGLAVGRTLVAILENYQEANGQIRVPSALVPYMGGLEVIG